MLSVTAHTAGIDRALVLITMGLIVWIGDRTHCNGDDVSVTQVGDHVLVYP